MAYGHFFRTRSPLKRCRYNARPAARPTFCISGCSSGVFFRALSPSRLAPDVRLSVRIFGGTFPHQRFYWLKYSAVWGGCQGGIVNPAGQFLQGFFSPPLANPLVQYSIWRNVSPCGKFSAQRTFRCAELLACPHFWQLPQWQNRRLHVTLRVTVIRMSRRRAWDGAYPF